MSRLFRQCARPRAAFSFLALSFAAAPAAWAAAPVTLTDANTASNPITYSAGPFIAPTAVSGCAADQLCDSTQLTVNVSPAVAAASRIVVWVEWPRTLYADFDVSVVQGANSIAASASSTDPEIARFHAVNGTYTINTASFQPAGNSISAKVYLEPIPAAAVPPSGAAPSYQIFAPPGESITGGEPSIGTNWNTGVAVVGNASDAAFITFDDSKSPVTATWENRPPPTNVASFDPILFADSATGMTVVSQLVSDVATFSNGCSLSSVSFDDGATWIPAEGCGPPAGADHQGIGGGPHHAPLVDLPGPVGARAVYYCAQAFLVLVLGDVTCARSDDGGLTYGPSVVVYPTACGGKHGHPRVSPDGTVYLPNAQQCAGDAGLGQGLAISEDNGLTWTYSVVPGSTPSQSDPSVATGLNDTGKAAGQSGNTIYFGYCDGDGLAKVAVSRDQGASWGNVFNVGAAAGVKNCVFPEMIAGDDNRAAFFFLGTTVPGAFQAKDFPGEWHGYVATTYDGGKSWGLTDATPNDPVQIGCVWLQGGSNPCRNLLDFNDITVDKQGRPLFVFTDGCTGKCVPGARATTSRKAVDTVGRQSGCKTLFAEFDATVGSKPCGKAAENIAAGSDPVPLSGGALPLSLLAPLFGAAAFRRRRLALGLASLLAGGSAWASPPVTLTDANTESNPITYSVGPSVVTNIPPPVVGETSCDEAHPCDETALTVSVSAAVAAAKQVKVVVSWPMHEANADYDLYILQGGKETARSAGIFDPEIATFDAVNGEYNVRVVEFDPQGNTFTAKIFLEPIPATAKPAKGAAATYDTFPAPNGLGTAGGEPSIGVNWNTGAVATQADTQTLFTWFDDSTSPATAKWEDRSSPFSAIDFDPILYTDSVTGRTVVSLLVTDPVLFTTGCSDSSHTDDDGVTWVPNDGCGHPAGSDHQALGGGNFAAPLAGLLDPVYPRAMYYCAQEAGVLLLAPALCSRSDDGGLTWGPAITAAATDCFSTHGHPKVAIDGTVYLPHHNCGASENIGNGVVVSTDNGMTWTARVVPGSSASESDPSVALPLNDTGRPTPQTSSTAYLGYCDGDGLAKVAVSRDQGQSWMNVFDVGAAMGIKNCMFAEMVAGDDNRASMFFLGTTTAGDTQDDKFAGVWHAYVATTLDGGNTWGLTDATPADPVQIGKICMGGISCTGGRNLLDFNDATVDKEGRLVGVFADGCLPPKCTSASTYRSSTRSQLTIIRQSGGPRLFSANDSPATKETLEGGHDPVPLAGPVSPLLALPLLGMAALRRRGRR
jgi:hypothetical protein